MKNFTDASSSARTYKIQHETGPERAHKWWKMNKNNDTYLNISHWQVKYDKWTKSTLNTKQSSERAVMNHYRNA